MLLTINLINCSITVNYQSFAAGTAAWWRWLKKICMQHNTKHNSIDTKKPDIWRRLKYLLVLHKAQTSLFLLVFRLDTDYKRLCNSNFVSKIIEKFMYSWSLNHYGIYYLVRRQPLYKTQYSIKLLFGYTESLMSKLVYAMEDMGLVWWQNGTLVTQAV